MRKFLPFTATALALALAACSDSETTSKGSEETKAASSEAATTEKSTIESVTEKATEIASKATEALKLDTSSFDSFKSSLASLKGSLDGEQSSQLTSALASLAKGATEEKGGLLSAAKDMASGKSIEETLYEKMGAKLNGMTFDDILALAG